MNEPYFWRAGLDPKSRQSAPLTRLLLTPLAWLYAWAGGRRIRRTTPHKPAIPVICIGNLTLGGSGKTPVAAALRERLAERGLRVATLSRGYKGSEKGPLRVDFSAHTAADVGDEPLLLSCTGEAWISRDRPAGVDAMAAAGVDLILMDDGHQNPTVEKALSLVVIDAGAPFGNGHVFPKGPLREPVPVGLARADAVILMGEGPVPAAVTAWAGPILRASLKPRGPAPHGPLVAFAGIGRPDKFFDSLKAAGGQIEETAPYADHHVFTDREIEWLRTLARERDARLITTEKDFVRLTPAQRDGVLAFPVEAVFENPEALDAILNPALQVRS